MKTLVSCMLLMWAILSSQTYSQTTGGHGTGQAIPQKAEKAELGAGPVGDNVDLFTGNLSLSYNFGSVATLSGLSFPISLSYSSSSLLAFDSEHSSGIPYGEGWSLAQGAITVETDAFDFGAGELPFDPQSRKMYSTWESRKVGQLHYSNIRLSLPGGISGRLVYKYPDQNDTTIAVYHLDAFESYVQVRFDGQKWEAHTDDGTVYVFSLPQYRLRNPTNTTARLNENEAETIIPLAEVGKWHLTEIYNPNHANTQKILFEYDQFGKQDLFAELDQPGVQAHLNAYQPQMLPFLITQVYYDSVTNYGQNPVVMQGDTIYPGLSLLIPEVKVVPVTAYSDVLLRSVTATDAQGQDISRVELKYKSWRPEDELANDLTALNQAKFLLLSDPNVIRADSMYSQKTVWFQGIDHAVSQSWHGQRPAQPTIPFGNNWKRYQHPAAHQNPLSRYQPQIDPGNPYIAKYPGLPSSYNLNPAWQYWATTSATTTFSNSLPFTHSVLESPRINLADLPPGDWYELRSLVKLDPANADADMNFDLRITSGVTDNHPLVNNVETTVSAGGQSFKLRPAALQGSNWTNPSGYYDNGYEIYSTTRNIVKWNPAYQKIGIFLATRNRFRLPNLPNEFEGFSVQIGPGSDNLKHNQARYNADDSYVHFYNNQDNLSTIRSYHNLSFGQWFGTGAPLEPLWRTDRFGLSHTNNFQKGQSGDRFLWWMIDPMNAYSANGMVQAGANQPTALTREQLKPSLYGTYYFNVAPYISQAHEASDDSHLQNMELVRIAKNPYMLDSVIFYVGNGNYGLDRIATAAYELEYDLQQVPVFNNVDRNSGNPIANQAGNYRVLNGDTLYRNMFQLTAIRRLDTDSTGNITTPASPAITLIEYMQDDRSTLEFNEGYLVKTYWTELGGKQMFEYDFPQWDSVQINQTRHMLSSDQGLQVMGEGAVYQQRVPIKKKITEVDSATRFTEYVFQNPVFFNRGYGLDEHFNNGMSHSMRANKVWGYAKAIVRRPYNNAGSWRVRSEYTYRTATATHVDSLLFGRLEKVEEYDSENRLTSRKETTYEATLAYQNGQHYHKPSVVHNTGHQIETPANFLTEFEPQYLYGTPEDRWMDSYFIRPKEQASLVRDVVNGNQISTSTKNTFFDWDENHLDTEGDYQEMYRDQNPNPWHTLAPWYNQSLNQFSYHAEPSWQLASTTITSSDHPDAFQTKNYYYLWDIEPFLSFFGGLVERFEGSHRPFYLARKYGIRSAAYEEKVSSWNGNPDEAIYNLSTYYHYDIFRDVPGDFVWDVDSSGYGRLCDTNDDNPMVNLRQAATYCFGEGKSVDTEEATIQLLDDPRYVKSGGQWYFFPVESYTAIDLAETAQPQPSCSGGVVIGLKSEANYFGTLNIQGGGSIAASSVTDASRNYGLEGNSTTLTDGSKEKTVLLAFLPHAHDSTLCDRVHGFASDSAMTAAVNDSSGGPGNQRQNFIDMLDHQFFLRGVYQQADTVTNYYLTGDSLHNGYYPSPHNLWDTLNTQDVYQLTPYRFVFRPPFPTIRTYMVHERNMHGQILDESDVRHLHTLYEYGKGFFRSWFDKCGVHRTAVARWHFGLPRSVTITDFEVIEHVSKFDFFRDNSIKRITAPDSAEVSYEYDGKKRLTREYLNGLARQNYAYHQWNGDRSASWDDRIGMNYVETIAEIDPGNPTIKSRGYVDPVGRTVQTVTGVYDYGVGWIKSFSGPQKFDNWDRVTVQERPYFKTLQQNLDYDPVYTPGPTAMVKFEHSANSRPLRSSKPGNNIATTASTSVYEIISLAKFQTETGASNSEVSKLYPTVGTAYGGGGGQGGGNTQGNKGTLNPTGPAAADIYLFKTTNEDEDGRRVIEYANSSGWKLATLAYTDSLYSDKVLTLFAHDAAGRVVCTIHPNKLVSSTKFNLFGWPYQSTTPDRGLTRLFYNQAGDLRLSQNAKRKSEGNAVSIHYDRLGRPYREEIVTLAPVYPGANLEYHPLVYADTLGITFSNVQTIADELWRHNGDENANHVIWNGDYTGFSFPVLQFPETSQRKLAERRYDYPLDSLVSNAMIPASMQSILHPNVPTHQHRTLGRLVAESIFDTQGQPVEISVFSYTDEGQTDWLTRQFRAEGITPLSRGKAHRINYLDYGIQGSLLKKGIDLGADGTLELTQHYTYNDIIDVGFGQLRDVLIDDGNGPHLVARHEYDLATGSLKKLRYYTWNDNCGTSVQVDSLEYQFDIQDRITGMNSRMLNYDLFYDAQNVNQGLVGSEKVSRQQNYNGNIIGWRFDYDVASHGVTGFNSGTVYGFHYDGLNRLVSADASVLELNLASLPPVSNSTVPYGGVLTSTNPAWYGDGFYEYDKVGNLTGLKRYKYFAPGAPVSGSLGENWQYHYQSGSNRLDQLVTGGQQQALFNYDILGNLVRDTRAGITVPALDHRDLPTSLIKQGDTTRYLYGQGDGRIWKSRGADDYSYYLRDASGTPAAIWSEADTTWTFELHGRDLFAEYVMHADSSDSTARMLPPGSGGGGAREWFRRGRNVVLGAVAGWLSRVATSGEGRRVQRPTYVEMAIPLVLALSDLVEDAVTPEPPSTGANERSSSPFAGPDLKFFVKDHLGNVRVAYRPLYEPDSLNGPCVLAFEVVSVMDFYPYGKILRSHFVEGPERVQTTGHERDSESDWDYRGARYYSADYGRFLSVDPRAYDFTEWSPYNYVLANPVMLLDPDGEAPDCCPWEEFAIGFADRAAQIGFVPYGIYKTVKSAPETANGLYETGKTLISGKGEWYDYVRFIDRSGVTATYAEIQHIRKMYDAGKYEELGAYTYDAILAVFAAGAELQSMPGKSKQKPRSSSSSTSTIENIELMPTANSIGGKIKYKGGQVGEFLANKKSIGNKLEITDIIYYPEKALGNELKNAFGPRAMLNTMDLLKDYARSQGYKQLRIQYQRAKNSSSAKPGKYFDQTFDL